MRHISESLRQTASHSSHIKMFSYISDSMSTEKIYYVINTPNFGFEHAPKERAIRTLEIMP